MSPFNDSLIASCNSLLLVCIVFHSPIWSWCKLWSPNFINKKNDNVKQRLHFYVLLRLLSFKILNVSTWRDKSSLRLFLLLCFWISFLWFKCQFCFVFVISYVTLPEMVAVVNYFFEKNDKAEAANDQRNWFAINKYALFHD